MKIHVFYDSRLPAIFGADAITLYPFIFFNLSKDKSIEGAKHEVVHVRQVRKLGWLKFYSDYVWQWLKGMIVGKGFDGSYLAISYEVEAYALAPKNKLTPEELEEFGFTSLPSVAK